jgi:hypothetical protein
MPVFFLPKTMMGTHLVDKVPIRIPCCRGSRARQATVIVIMLPMIGLPLSLLHRSQVWWPLRVTLPLNPILVFSFLRKILAEFSVVSSVGKCCPLAVPAFTGPVTSRIFYLLLAKQIYYSENSKCNYIFSFELTID